MSQIFSEYIPYEYILFLIQEVCYYNNNMSNGFYKLNKTIFKQCMFNNKITPILDELKDYYKKNKQTYIEKGTTYKGFISILRQICKLWDIKFDKKVKYDKNTYDIEYYFYI